MEAKSLQCGQEMEKMEVGRKHSGTSNNVQRGVFGLYLFAITVVKKRTSIAPFCVRSTHWKSFLSCYVLPLHQ